MVGWADMADVECRCSRVVALAGEKKLTRDHGEVEAPELWRLVGEAGSRLVWAAAGYEAHFTPHASLVMSGEPSQQFNYGVIDEHPSAGEQLREYVELLQARRLPATIIITDAAERLTPLAAELGLREEGSMPLMTYTPDGPPGTQSPYSIEHVIAETGLRDVAHLMVRAFALPTRHVERLHAPGLLDAPGLDMYLLRNGGTPLSTVKTTTHGSTVGIWDMATTPAQQRKGAGCALLNYVLQYHCARGARLFYLLATGAGKPLYERLGFRTMARGVVWSYLQPDNPSESFTLQPST